MVTKRLIAKKKDNSVPHMVFVDGGHVPCVVHHSLKDARNEAKRLAEKHPNRIVRVFQIMEQYRGDVTPNLIPFAFPPEDEEVPF
jgi:hypothetical protein